MPYGPPVSDTRDGFRRGQREAVARQGGNTGSAKYASKLLRNTKYVTWVTDCHRFWQKQRNTTTYAASD